MERIETTKFKVDLMKKYLNVQKHFKLNLLVTSLKKLFSARFEKKSTRIKKNMITNFSKSYCQKARAFASHKTRFNSTCFLLMSCTKSRI